MRLINKTGCVYDTQLIDVDGKDWVESGRVCGISLRLDPNKTIKASVDLYIDEVDLEGVELEQIIVCDTESTIDKIKVVKFSEKQKKQAKDWAEKILEKRRG